MDYAQSLEFSKHPIRAYDPAYTKDITMFQSTFDDFVHFTRGALLSNPSRIIKGLLVSHYVDVIQKVKSYEMLTGVALLPYTFTGRITSHHSLFSSDYLTYDTNNGHYPL